MSKYDKGCMMIRVSNPEIDKIREKVDENDVYNNEEHEFGFETNPHVTLLFGIKPKTDVNILKELLPPLEDIKMIGSDLSIFENEEYDVLKIDVKSPILHKLNKKICDNVDYENDYPNYHPHITIAYLKKGEGNKYTKDMLDKIIDLKPTKYDYSDGEENFYFK